MKFDESKSSGQHGELAKLVGEWSGMTKTWFEPDVLADESPMTGTIKPLLGGRFVMHEYRGEMRANLWRALQFTALTSPPVSFRRPGSTAFICQLEFCSPKAIRAINSVCSAAISQARANRDGAGEPRSNHWMTTIS